MLFFNLNENIFFRLSQVYKHIAGLLFKIEAGVNDSIACTSKLCTWIVPSNNQKISQPTVNKMEFEKTVYGRESKII